MVKDESSSEGTIVSLRMINLVKHEKKLSSALPIKPNLQHVKRRNVVPTPLLRAKTAAAASKATTATTKATATATKAVKRESFR